MEGKHIANHPCQHEQPPLKGMETSHDHDPHDIWVCHRCGWTYPNPHPSAKHRRNHKKHCGKIEGFKLISTVNNELKGGSSDDDLSEDEHISTVDKKMVGEHITDHQHQHEHTEQSAGIKISHTKVHHDVYICHWCGWPYPNPHPGPKHRRNHRKHCGKIEGFKLIISEDREIQGQGGSSDEVSSDDEHKSIEHIEIEGKHIDSHQHERDQQQCVPGGIETHHAKDPHDVCICHRCGWTYPNAHPSAKHRRNHKKHCGKIEGFKLITSEDRETQGQGGSSDEVSSDDEHKSIEHVEIEGKHINGHQHECEQQQCLPAGIETHHVKDPHDVCVCHQCGWTYPNAHPSAKHRRNHKKHCGKIEGFKLITSEDRETQGQCGSSDEVSSDDEHKSIEHAEIEGKHINGRQRECEQQQCVPAGIETHHAKDPHDACICHRCGWTYPNTHPSAKHRRNHKKHCGKIEGFKLINSGDTDTHRGSSEEELSDDEHKSIDHESLGSHEDNNVIPQTHASAPKPDNNSSNLDVSSSEANVGKAAQKVESSNGATLHSSQIIVPDAKVSNLSSLHESAEAATGTTIGLGLHGLIVSGTIEPPKNSTEHDILSFKHESTSFFNEIPNRDKSQDASGPVENQEFTVKGHHDYAELKIQNNKIDDGVWPMLGESIPSVVQPHPSSDDLGDGCDLQIMNDSVKDDPRVSKEQPGIPKDVKISFAKLQDPGKIELPRDFSKSATTAHAPIHHNKGIGSRRVGIASILSFKETSSDDLNANSSSVKEAPASAGKTIYELAQINHQVSDGNTQEVSISEMKEQEMQHDVRSTSDCSRGLSTILFSGADSHKENPQSWTLEPQIEKLPRSSAISIDSTSVTNLDLEEIGGAVHYQEANSTVAQGISDKPEVYSESKNASPINGDSESCREREKPQNFYNISSDKVQETEVPCSKGIEKTSGQGNNLQASSKVVIAVQDMSFVDGCLTESSKAANRQEVESSASVVSSIIDHDMNGFDPDCRKEDFTEQNSTLSDMDISRHDDANVTALEKMNKTPASEVVVDEKPAAPEFHPLDVDYSHEGNKTVEQDIFVKLEDHVESTNISLPICGDTDKSRDEEKPGSFHCKFSDGMLHLEEDKEKVIEDALSKQKPAKESCSEAVETTSGKKQEAQDSSIVILDPEISCTDNPPTGNSKAGEREEVECHALSSSIIECGMNDCSPDCKREDSTRGNVILPEKEMHGDTKVIVLETQPKITINEAINENSVGSKSHQLEAMVYTDEEKSTVEQAISVKPEDYIESKHISPSNGVSDSHRDERSPNSSVGNNDDILQPEVDKSMTIGSDLHKHAFLDEAKVPYSEGIERDIEQKLDLQTSSELIIPDHRMSLTGSSPVEDSKSGQMQASECSGFTNLTIIEHDSRDGDPGCKSKSSIQGNTVLPDVNMDGDIDTDIRPQEKFPKAPANEVNLESAALESSPPKTRDTDSSFQGDDQIDLEAEIQREESECEGNEKGPEHSVMEQIAQLQADRVFVDMSCSATMASSHLNGSTDNLENSIRESIDDAHGDKSELMKSCEPAVWEQLLETNVNKSINQESYQDPGNAGTSPGNPFIYENKLSSKEEVSQSLAIEGRHGLISDQLKNTFAEVESMPSTINSRVEQDPIINCGNGGGGDIEAIHSKEKVSVTPLMAPEDMFEAPSFMTLVESGNHSDQQLSHNEIQPKVKESNGESSADAEMASGTHERFHTPLRSLLAEENMRGTQEHSIPDPLLVFQPQTSSQNKIQVVHSSTVEVSDQTGTSSQKLTLPLKDINSSSKKLAEKVWNSPARLPNLKVEKPKVSKVKSAWTMCLCGCDTK